MALPPRLFHLPVPAILALRYLRSSRKDSFVTFLSLVAGIGLALGVAVLILALGALSGFQRVLLDEVLARTPQVEVELPAAMGGEAVALAEAAVRGTDGVEEVWRVVRGQGWVVPRGRRPMTVELVGFGDSLPPTLGEPVEAGEPAAGGRDGAWLPADFAAGLGLAPGDRLEVASPRPTLAPVGGPQPRLRSVVVAGWYEPRGEAGKSLRVALPRAVASSLLAPVPTFLEIDAGGLERAPAVAAAVERAVAVAMEAAPEVAGSVAGGVRVVTWRQLEAPLFFVLRLEKAMMFVAISLIVLVASLALVASLSLVIANKRSEIGMLGAMGATPRALERTFLLYGGVLTVLGAGTGALLGLGGAWVLDTWELLAVPGDVYFVSHVPFRVLGRDLALVLGVTLVLALGAALYAARRAAALTPVEAIRQ